LTIAISPLMGCPLNYLLVGLAVTYEIDQHVVDRDRDKENDKIKSHRWTSITTLSVFNTPSAIAISLWTLGVPLE
jgi:hypothetical protein